MAAITSKFRLPLHRTNVLIKAPEGGLSVDSVVRLDQVRSVDKRRLLKRLGVLKPATMLKVDRAIKISLGLVIGLVTAELNAAGDLIGIEILDASTFLRDAILEGTQARLLHLGGR